MRDGCDSGSGRAALHCVKLIDCGDAGRPGYMREQELAWAIGGCCARAPCQACGASFAWRRLCPLSSGAVVALSTCHLRFAHAAANLYREGYLSVMKLRFSRGDCGGARWMQTNSSKQVAESVERAVGRDRHVWLLAGGGDTIVVGAYVGMHGLGVGVAGVDGREMDLGVGGDGVGAGRRWCAVVTIGGWMDQSMGLIACQRGASRLSPPLADAGWLAGLWLYAKARINTNTPVGARA
jgi:hypothetical protein